ncbi:MAG: hypothetical protein INQ03_24360, partial [Candidatus Heimdallarchaeota archaeon]|nr:hypothetical protein [Candidatus Heimdallarchaeota archaeon]
MAIFTRRGGSIVFLGFMSIAFAIGMAGYMAINILTTTFFGDMLTSFNENGLDFTWMYPN